MINKNLENSALSMRDGLVQLVIGMYILLFLYTATSKLADYDTFQIQMSKSPFITGYAATLVWLVPGLEIGIALLLMFPATKVFGLYGSFCLMSLFTIYVFGILHFSQEIPCSCGGIISAMSWQQHLLFNVFFVLLAVIAIVFQTDNSKKTDLSEAP